MRPTAGCTHILFDFFGTLVDYSAVPDQGHPRTVSLLRRLGADLTHDRFVTTWARTWEEFDRRGDATGVEFAMPDIASAYLTQVLPGPPTPAGVTAFVTEYVAEWNSGVRYPQGVADLVRDLAADHRLAVVTNTHEPALVPAHLAAMGVRERFETVITSIEVGWRKPRPEIFRRALATLGIEAATAVFVGDSYRPDFVGPEGVGIRAYLIDPGRLAPVPGPRRLASILDLPDRLAAHRESH